MKPASLSGVQVPALAVLLWFFNPQASPADPLVLQTRARFETIPGNGQYQTVEKTVRWEPKKTAVVICDMWDAHWCKGAAERVTEMAPAMNLAVKQAREQGVLIIHAPSETMDFYKDTPQRK